MEYMQVNRANGRAANELRPVKLTRGVMKHAHGSCLAEFGDTHVLCAATIEEGVPGWRKGAKAGWVTAEYAMLPASTGKRCKREHANRKGRPMEMAATCPISGMRSILPASTHMARASCSATQAPVMLAVRVPPSA